MWDPSICHEYGMKRKGLCMSFEIFPGSYPVMSDVASLTRSCSQVLPTHPCPCGDWAFAAESSYSPASASHTRYSFPRDFILLLGVFFAPLPVSCPDFSGFQFWPRESYTFPPPCPPQPAPVSGSLLSFSSSPSPEKETKIKNLHSPWPVFVACLLT